MKRALVTILYLLPIGPLFGQNVENPKPTGSPSSIASVLFEVHGDALGDAFTTFQARHADASLGCHGDPETLATHNLHDSYSDLPVPPKKEYAKGFLTCEVNGDTESSKLPGGESKLTIVGHKTLYVHYDFFEDRLFAITAVVLVRDRASYDEIKEAYSTKYGKPMDVTSQTYQNGFGATFRGEQVTWHDPSRNYILVIDDNTFTPDSKFVNVRFADLTIHAKVKSLKPSKTNDL